MKKSILLTGLAFITLLKIYSQNILPTNWKFSTGDDTTWAKSSFDDKAWKEIQLGSLWETQGYDKYNGYAWYRTKVVVPSTLKAQAEKNGGFLLTLGKIDDADQTYLNGKLIGQTGGFPPAFEGKYDETRIYKVPASTINWDKPNVIAVRVYDHIGGGGIYEGETGFRVKGTVDFLNISPSFLTEDRVVRDIIKENPALIIKNEMADAIKGKFTIRIVSDFKQTVFENTIALSIGAKSQETVKLQTKDLKPGFYECIAFFEGAGTNKRLNFPFAVEPEKIASPADPQPDFDNYWTKAKKELAAVAPKFKIIKQDTFKDEKRDFYVVEMQSLGNVLVRGWYIRPKKQGKYPAILHLQGYSTFLQSEWMYSGDDIIAFGLNIRGHGFSKDNVNPGFPGYILSGIEDKEKYIYRGAYMDCIRAVDFLYSRPEVDTTKIATEGGSQGGALSIATAALDNKRINICMPHVPFLSDFRDYFIVGNWPANEFIEYVAKNPKVGWDKVYQTLSYIDIKNLAPKIKCPVYMAIGLKDVVCPPHINFAAYNNMNVHKEYVVYPEAGHGLPMVYHTVKYEWLKKQWGMK